ncbi:hypothetical protein Vretimale_11555 [Volvox reticuliferus]|uniref:YLP motif-containing protein 1 n=1 Tax=Volvox reticuliferus TaxID=1737510 RepID=A0A8J4GIC6_9CHLO|nr:hypothetical protein Vretifemale_14834 [Volvox reticuliferus]GIM07438.1 hypothetical protein Vretimale_11555 [Volvox reticuliferus]
MPVEEELPPLPPDAPAGPVPVAPIQESQAPVQPSYPPSNQAPPAQTPITIAVAETWGMSQFPPVQQQNGILGQGPASTNTGAWPPQQAQHAHQAAFGHLGQYPHAFPPPYPSQIPPSLPQPLSMQQRVSGFAQHPPHHHHQQAVLPTGQPIVSPYGSAGAAALQLPPAQQAVSAPAPPPAPVVLDITRLLRPPHRATRPRKLLLVLRGLPGSGKSTLARKIREAELEAGAEAPRLHSMDDYYMQEVEVEVVEEEAGRKKRRRVTELKYVFEPEMEDTYFRDLIRAVGRSCEDRRHSFVVIDAPVLRAEQLRELMTVGQRANFECFALLPLETDPTVCASPSRNVHGHSAEALQGMAASFEPAPPLYAQVSALSLFGGPVVGEEQDGSAGLSEREAEIQEVDMDAEDSDEEADGNSLRGDREGDADGGLGPSGSLRQRPTSRWHEDDGEFNGVSGVRRLEKRRKRDKAKLRAVAEIDEKDILLGLNDALAATPDVRGGFSSNAPPPPVQGSTTGRTLRPLRSALRRSPSAAASAVAAHSNGKHAPRRVWWPDMGQGILAEAKPPSTTAAATTGLQLVEVVYLEGLGPPAELEDLPYGYQRRNLTGREEAAAGSNVAGDGAANTQPRAGHPQSHGSFRDQAKAEHESEHDLFRRLLLGRQGVDAEGGQSSVTGGSPLGLFAAPLDEDEEEA